PMGARDVKTVGLDVAAVVGDAGGEHLGGALRALGRARCRGSVGGDDRRIGRQRVGHLGLRTAAPVVGRPLAAGKRLGPNNQTPVIARSGATKQSRPVSASLREIASPAFA